MKKQESRKGFVKSLTAAVAATAIGGWFLLKPKKEEQEMITMLLPNGKPVKVPKATAEASKKGKKASNKEVQNWMKSENP